MIILPFYIIIIIFIFRIINTFNNFIIWLSQIIYTSFFWINFYFFFSTRRQIIYSDIILIVFGLISWNVFIISSPTKIWKLPWTTIILTWAVFFFFIIFNYMNFIYFLIITINIRFNFIIIVLFFFIIFYYNYSFLWIIWFWFIKDKIKFFYFSFINWDILIIKIFNLISTRNATEVSNIIFYIIINIISRIFYLFVHIL